MKKSFFAKIAVMAAVILTVTVWTYAHQSPNIPEDELTNGNYQYINIAEYEQKRAELYDAALDLCMEASEGAYVWEEWVSEENKHIILTYRVPSLEVLLSAIEQMDGDGCLNDSFDESLFRFDKAFYEYNKIAKIK